MNPHKPLTIERIDRLLEQNPNYAMDRVSPDELQSLLRLARRSLEAAPSDEVADVDKVISLTRVMLGSAITKLTKLDNALLDEHERVLACAFARKPRLSDEELEAVAKKYAAKKWSNNSREYMTMKAYAALDFKAGYALAWEGEKWE